MITVEASINAPIKKVWECWTNPEHITKWNNASDDWHTPYAENDLRTGGKFKSTMAAKDGTMSFDFEGEYTLVEKNKAIEYVMADGRKVEVSFEETPVGIYLIESFDPENVNSEEMQQLGWQAILDNFKKYVEALHA
ncbi:MAG TPA: SRPBCC family protein [Flavobacterium sp.]|uniref:SRPBCC family protein n=1 Tax=Flavobacterium sp. TaxID=239 RepID=UPI002DBE949C|nr:SRPBCC family protein [Flavobacterium sp.]HEU4790323.1 SRPBCC family protein [Flavobacterium sp.]